MSIPLFEANGFEERDGVLERRDGHRLPAIGIVGLTPGVVVEFWPKPAVFEAANRAPAADEVAGVEGNFVGGSITVDGFVAQAPHQDCLEGAGHPVGVVGSECVGVPLRSGDIALTFGKDVDAVAGGRNEGAVAAVEVPIEA